MKISKEHIRSWIPQRDPFIMVDNLLCAGDGKIETDFLILPGNLFLQDGVLSEYALVENIAQSCAAGLRFIAGSGHLPDDGLIGAVSRLKLYGRPVEGDTLHTVVTLLGRFANLVQVKGENYCHGEKLLECELKLAGL